MEDEHVEELEGARVAEEAARVYEGEQPAYKVTVEDRSTCADLVLKEVFHHRACRAADGQLVDLGPQLLELVERALRHDRR